MLEVCAKAVAGGGGGGGGGVLWGFMYEKAH